MALLTIVRRVDVDKIMRQTMLMLKVLLCFDVFFIISTIVEMIWYTPALIQGNDGDWDFSFLLSDVYIHGYCILSIFSLSFMCNSFACAGVTNKKRMLLLPWLIVYMMFKILLIASFISDVLFNPFNVSQIFLLCLLLLVMSAWRHMQVVFIVMGLPRAAATVNDTEASEEAINKVNDVPPTYEDVTEKPPKYDEATMTQ
eukprot:TRINITY_DN38756_c0_g1_i2.p1 TRINITY_DN38756_c0_g1~~TRINITY_DN38756_c0_g1_i2.p1  ORF type:complete len:209 (-),score=46.82 TRINITY_DN38756_c0_g1_i2:153-752(-)